MKKSMVVDGFEITAWKDEAGLMKMVIRGPQGREVMQGLGLPWENEGGALNRLAFTDSQAVISYSTMERAGEDGRTNPAELRKRAKDGAFCAWFAAQFASAPAPMTPLAMASAIEADRIREGRDLKTGAPLAKRPAHATLKVPA